MITETVTLTDFVRKFATKNKLSTYAELYTKILQDKCKLS